MARSELHRKIPENVSEYFEYDPDTGVVIRLKTDNNAFSENVGQPVGFINSFGYLQVTHAGYSWRLHRIIWYLMTGEDPGTASIDHIDRNRSNNCWSNLRLADSRTQALNVGSPGFFAEGGVLRVRYGNRGNSESLGKFICPLLARIVYHDRATRDNPELNIPFNHGGRIPVSEDRFKVNTIPTAIQLLLDGYVTATSQ